jgi:hypothetical protein
MSNASSLAPRGHFGPASEGKEHDFTGRSSSLVGADQGAYAFLIGGESFD